MDLSRVSRLELLLTKQLRIIRERDGGVRCVVYGYYPVHTANYSISFRNPLSDTSNNFVLPANPGTALPSRIDIIHTRSVPVPGRQRTAYSFIEGRDAIPHRRAHPRVHPYPPAPHHSLLLIMPPHLPHPKGHHPRGPIHGAPSTGRPWQRHRRRTLHRATAHGGSPRAMRA